MRFHLLGLILLASVAAPAAAQRAETGRATGRAGSSSSCAPSSAGSFPNGNVEPEIGDQPAAGPGGNLSGDAVASLTARVDALEAQLRTLTGQVEEKRLPQPPAREADRPAAHRSHRPARPARAARARRRRRGPSPRAEAAAAGRVRAARPRRPPSSNDGAEEAYNAGFRLWDARRYDEAQTALEAAAVRYPSSRWTSWMRNLQGRAYLDDNKPATAARVLLANYQDNPRGRARRRQPLLSRPGADPAQPPHRGLPGL